MCNHEETYCEVESVVASGSSNSGSSRRSSKSSLVTSSIFYRAVFILIFSHFWPQVEGGICWLNVDAQGRCSTMLEVGVSRDECCATDSENVGWLEGDHYSDSDLFRMSFLTDGGVPNCYTCQRTCETLQCEGDKRCRVRNGQAACVCDPPCDHHTAKQRRPVCGTDGRTYSSECSLLRNNCRRGRQTEVEYYGRCQNTCSRVKCQNGEGCIIDQNGTPHCIPCAARCPAPPPGSREFCGADGETYPSLCHYKRALCLHGRSIGIAYYGRCNSSLTCADITCSPSQRCLLNDRTQRPQCVSCHRNCQNLRPSGTVCGTDDVTYASWCDLNQEACSSGVVIQTKHAGRCNALDRAEVAQADDYFYGE